MTDQTISATVDDTFAGRDYSGLWYPLVFAALTSVVGLIVLPETKDADIRA